MSLELRAIHFLRWEKQCVLVLRERNPRWGCGEPDVLGVTKARYLLEIEVKRTMSDFRADSKKPHVANREHYLKRHPKQKWYLVDYSFYEKALNECPKWAGMMTVKPDEWAVSVIKKAPANKESERLTLKECVKLVNCVNNYNYSLERSIENFRSNFKWPHEPYIGIDTTIPHYQI